MKRALQFLGRCIREKRRYLFYGYQPAQGAGMVDPDVQVYSEWKAVPPHFRKIAAASPWRNAMYYRMRRGQARLLCCSKDGVRLAAYGWIQDWAPFRRRFGAIAQDGAMLGFYWTAPEVRGQGLYGRLLAHSLAVCSKERPIVICVSPDNPASRRGIEKAGFAPLGEWEGTTWFRCCGRLRRISDGLR